MKKEVCSRCGAEARIVRGNYEFKELGLKRVALMGIEIIQCEQCGNSDPIIPNINGLMRVLATAVIKKPYRLGGEEVRFLRKYLKMTGEEFSRLLHVDKTTLSKWENNDDKVGEQSDLLIRALTLALGSGLKEKIEEAVREFENINRKLKPVRIGINAETMEYQYG